jgi:DNA-binding MarR family transcriptional regulator
MVNDARAIKHLFESESLGAPENAIGFVLWRVVHRYQREVDRALAEHGLTHLQFTTLMMTAWLAQSGEAVPQATLAQSSDIQPMQLSHMLRALEDKGLVSRARSTHDERAKCVEVTAAGVTALHRTLPLVIDIQQRLFGDDGRPGGSLLSALLCLDREHMGASRQPGSPDAISGTGQPGL